MKGLCTRSHKVKEGNRVTLSCLRCFALQARLRPSERLMAFLDDIHGKSDPDRSAAELLRVGIRVHDGKTQLWNRSGVVPTGAQALTEPAQRLDPEAIVWRGDVSLPPQEQGVMVLGTPMGQPEFVRSRLAGVSAKHDRLVSQIVGMSDLQCAWVLLLHCASARPNYMLRVVHPIECRVCGAPRRDHATGSPSMHHVLGYRQPPIFSRGVGPSKCSSDS